MKRPESDLESLRHDLHQVYDGDPWHGSSITNVLEGIDADAASLRSIPHAHTIWELVLHMTSWTREVASRVGGAGGCEAGSRRGARRAGAEGSEAGARGFAAWVGDQREPAAGTGVPVGTVIRGLLQHHTYHQGQIAILRRAAETRS